MDRAQTAAVLAALAAIAAAIGYALRFRKAGTSDAWIDEFRFVDEAGGPSLDDNILIEPPPPFSIEGPMIESESPDPVLVPRTTRGLRNRNPGNIRWIAEPSSRWRGMIRNDGTNYAVFDTDANGVRALAKQLLVYESRYNLRTVRGIINRWAPPSENDTGSYVRAVAQFMGVSPDAEISVNQRLDELVYAVIKHENGIQPYTQADLSTWSRLA